MTCAKSSVLSRFITVVLFGTLAAGCSEYLDRRDTLTLSAGNAQAANRMAHVADPWQRHAFDTDIDGDGKRLVEAVETYRDPPEPPPPPQKVILTTD
ncbi:MAG: pilus assembly protein [Pseudomonadota bacterium]